MKFSFSVKQQHNSIHLHISTGNYMHIKEALGTCNQSKGKKAEKFQLNSSMWNLLVTFRILFLNYDNCIFKFFIYATLQFFFKFKNKKNDKIYYI